MTEENYQRFSGLLCCQRSLTQGWGFFWGFFFTNNSPAQLELLDWAQLREIPQCWALVKSWLGWASTPNKPQISAHLFSTPLEKTKKLQVECISIKKCCGWWCTEPGNVFAAATRAVFSFFLKFLLLQLQLCFSQRVRDQSWSSLNNKDH